MLVLLFFVRFLIACSGVSHCLTHTHHCRCVCEAVLLQVLLRAPPPLQEQSQQELLSLSPLFPDYWLVGWLVISWLVIS